MHRNGKAVGTELGLLTERARREPKSKFTSLAHLLNEEYLACCFEELRKQASPGVDGVTYEEYSKELSKNLGDLVNRMKAGQYRPQPVRRVYIPKDEKSKRPLGIPALEDKIVQMGITRILEAIFEVEFLDVSYGFRRGRGCHQALQELADGIRSNPVNYVVDADIKGFFDSVDHKRLMECLGVRIVDRNFLRLVVRFLKAGVMEEGKYVKTERGTPQGGNLSPILSNIFLHYVLDRWMERTLKPTLKGYAALYRYADDFVICVQAEEEAKKILEEIEERFRKVGLSLSEEKTRLVTFGRYAVKNAARRGEKPGTFDFLGFTHFDDKTRRGGYKVGRATSRKKFRQKMKAMNEWLKAVRCTGQMRDWWSILEAKVLGHYHYYGVSGNWEALQRYYEGVRRMVYKWLGRRSQKKRYNWERFQQYLDRHPIPRPKIHHNLYTLSMVRGV